jgi:DNA-binding beta-propeller fold protein YncE
MVANQPLRSAAVPGTMSVLHRYPPVQRRWLRLVLLVGALASGMAGQYWLSIHYAPPWSAAAWAAAVICFVLLYTLAPEASALPSPQDGVGSRNREWALLGLVLAAGIFITVVRLRTFPPGLNQDAAYEGLYALRILHGLPYTPYTAEAWGRETFTFYLRAISIWWLGPTRLAVTVPSTVAGVLILPFFFVWARRMFGLRFGLMATLFLGVSGWHLVFSRTGWRSDFQPLFMAITCCFFIRGMDTGNIIDFALSGLGLAAGLNTYNGARLFPLLFPLWVVGLVLQSWHWRGFLHRYGRGGLAMAVAFGVATTPLAWYAVHNWDVFAGRAYAPAGATTLAEALKATALLFNYRGNGDAFFINTPALEYPTAILLVFGVLWALVKLRDERVQFVLLGLVITVVPGLVSEPNLKRDVGTMPFVYFFVAMGAVFFAEQARRLVPHAGRVIAGAVLVVAGVSATQATYSQYLGQHPRSVWGYYPETTVLGNYIKTLVPHYTTWVGGADFPRDALTYLSYTGQIDPMQRNYTWVDDVQALLQMQPALRPGKGIAFVLANEGVSATVLSRLEGRYPQHHVVDVRYPAENGRVFAKALLVAPGALVSTATAELPTTAVEQVPPPPAAEAVTQVAAGELREPRGVAVTKDGMVVVCDFGNNRIQEFGRDLRVVRQWGGPGESAGQFNQPCGIAVGADGQIFVADTWNQRVQVFSPEGRFLRQWAAAFYGPRGIAVDATGTVFVADTGKNRIVRFSAAGQKEKEWGGKGSEPGRFIEPMDVAVDATGQVYVCDNGNARLQVFNRDGRFLSQFPVPGWESEVYSEPHVTVEARGTIWVTVPGAKEVRGYDRNGKLLRTITGREAGGAAFEKPMGIAYSTATHELIVTDLNNRVLRIPDVTK